MAERASGIPVVVMGLGHIGRAIARSALEKPELRIVGAVEVAPHLTGRNLGEILGAPAPDVTVTSDPSGAYRIARGGVLLHATHSAFERVLPELEGAVRAGLSVVSTCEELAYPWLRHEPLADALDALCEQNDVAVIGTGVNPGFALDRLPAFLSQVVGPVRHILAVRVVDAATRRAALQRKIGAGLSEEVFHDVLDRGEIGHIGLAESAALAALGSGLELDEVDEEVEPLLADRDYGTAVPVRMGEVAGIHHIARGFADGQERVRLELTIAVGAQAPRDEVEIDATPSVRASIPGGVFGDLSTAWSVVNATVSISMLRGLVTVLDLPSGR